VPIVAARAGAFANAPFVDGSTSGAGGALQIADVPFDASVRVVSYDAAGGSDGRGDDDLRREASAYARGQYGPTSGAVLAGALRGTGAHRVAVRDITRARVDGASTLAPAAFTSLTVADVSWSSSRLWLAGIAQGIGAGFLGHGCVVRVAGVTNTRVRCELAVTVRDPVALSDPSGITQSIQTVLGRYFDDRPDWWTWRLAQIRAVVSRADPRVLVCTRAAVHALGTDEILTEPTLPVATASGLTLPHWMLVANGVSVTYQPPS
jgi:hypothetical protein